MTSRNHPSSASALTAIEGLLSIELGDAMLAERLAKWLVEDTLSWHTTLIERSSIDTLVAFSFGNRINPNGNREPGPVNRALADILIDLHKDNAAHIYAQWEIAEAVGTRIPARSITPVFPTQNVLAEPVYLSTDGVMTAISRLTKREPQLGRVGIVAFSDHQFRCVTVARRHGLDAFAPAGVSMPSEYDTKSGQPWCRNRLAYLLHDIAERINTRRADAIGPARKQLADHRSDAPVRSGAMRASRENR